MLSAEGRRFARKGVPETAAASGTREPIDGRGLAHPARPTNRDERQTTMRKTADLYETVTAKIIAAMEAGAGDWEMPWHRPGTSFTLPVNVSTAKTYRGVNILSLWIDQELARYPSAEWASYKQWAAMGAQVRKGEKGSLVVVYKDWERRITDAKPGEPETETVMMAKSAWVFNAAQVDGYAAPEVAARPDLTETLASVDAYIAGTGADIRHGGTRAFYRHRSASGDGDFIQMPPRNLFTGTKTSTPTEAYYSTLLHECGHLSGAAHRLNREMGKRFGDAAYAAEELVAELTAAYLCAQLGISNAPRADHAQYLAHWLKLLAADERAVFTAASHAARAADYLNSLQPTALAATQAEAA